MTEQLIAKEKSCEVWVDRADSAGKNVPDLDNKIPKKAPIEKVVSKLQEKLLITQAEADILLQ